MPEDINNDMADLVQQLYNESLDEDDQLIRDIIQIESQAKLREHSTRARKDKIKLLLSDKLGL